MNDIGTIIDNLIHLSDRNLISLFFKAFAVILSFLYLIYTIIAQRQTKLMIRTLASPRQGLILFISTLQVFVAIALVIMALLFV